MSSKQNKKHGDHRQRTAEAERIERRMLETQFPMECEALPRENLTDEEQLVVDKCIHHEKLSDDEFRLLKKTLQQYRKALHDARPEETISNAEKVINVIKSEKELLDILDDPNRSHLKVHLPIDGKLYELDFEVLPITDSRAVTSIELQTDIFNDYSTKEVETFSKAYNNPNAKLSPQEEAVARKIEKAIVEKANDYQSEQMVNLLAYQLRLPDSTDDLEARKNFWRKFPFNAKVSVWLQIKDRLGLNEETNELLFPDN